MKLIPLEEFNDWGNFPEPRELTPEVYREVMALAGTSITADDVLALTQVEGWEPAEILRAGEGNGSPSSYEVRWSGQLRAVIKKLEAQSAAEATGFRYLAVLQQILVRLKKDPRIFGEPQFGLPALQLVLFKTAMFPFVVYYGIHEERPLVFLCAIKNLLLNDDCTVDPKAAPGGVSSQLKLTRLEDFNDWENFSAPPELKPEECQKVMALANGSLMAEDIVALCQVEGWVSFEETLVEMEETQKQFDQRIS